jgi:hypothetical protein
MCARIKEPTAEILNAVTDWHGVNDFLETPFTTARGPAWVGFISDLRKQDSDDEEDVDGDEAEPHIHFHISCALNSFFKKEKHRTDKTVERETLIDRFDQFLGCEIHSVRIRTMFRIPISKVPKRGILDLMLGAEAEVGGETVILESGQASFVNKESLWKRMQWDFAKDPSFVEVKMIGRLSHEVIDENLMVRVETRTADALDRFIL